MKDTLREADRDDVAKYTALLVGVPTVLGLWIEGSPPVKWGVAVIALVSCVIVGSKLALFPPRHRSAIWRSVGLVLLVGGVYGAVYAAQLP